MHLILDIYLFSDNFNYQPDNFGTYMINAYLDLANKEDSEPTEAVFNAINKLFTLNELAIDLAPVPELLLSDVSNIYTVSAE